jgi:hypothetical protein
VRPAENTKRNIKAGCLDHFLDDIRVCRDGTFLSVLRWAVAYGTDWMLRVTHKGPLGSYRLHPPH